MGGGWLGKEGMVGEGARGAGDRRGGGKGGDGGEDGTTAGGVGRQGAKGGRGQEEGPVVPRDVSTATTAIKTKSTHKETQTVIRLLAGAQQRL